MANTNYYWYEIDNNNKIGNLVITPLNQQIVKNVLGVYLTSPIERKAIKKLPEVIRRIEDNTRMWDKSSDEDNKWSEDKMGEFKNWLQDAYKELMNMRLEEIVSTYIPQEEKRNWGGTNPALPDFIAEKYHKSGSKKGQKMEGTGFPKVKQGGELRDIQLKDLLTKDNRNKFIGMHTQLGRTKQAKQQKKIDTNMRKFTNAEFFNEDNLSRFNIKFVDKKTSRDKEGINITFTIDQTDGKIQRKIFEDAGYSKIIFKDDPTSYGLSIRDKWSPNWDDTTVQSEFFQSKQDGKFDPISIWTGDSDQKEEKRQEYTEQLVREGRGWKQTALQKLAGISGRYSTLENRLKKLKNELNNMASSSKEMYGLRLREGGNQPKDRLQEEIKDLEDFLNYVKNNHPKVFKGERTFAQERKYIEKMPSEVGQGYAVDRQEEAYDAKSHFDEERSILVSKADADLISETWKKWTKDGLQPLRSDIEELLKGWIENGELYDLIGPRANNSPWYLHRTTITLILNPKNIKNNRIYIPSIGKVVTTKMVSKEALEQPAQMQSKRQRKNIALPVARRAGQGATQMTHDSKGGSEKLGINAARKYWVRKFVTYNNKLKEAAQSIGATLEA